MTLVCSETDKTNTPDRDGECMCVCVGGGGGEIKVVWYKSYCQDVFG